MSLKGEMESAESLDRTAAAWTGFSSQGCFTKYTARYESMLASASEARSRKRQAHEERMAKQKADKAARQQRGRLDRAKADSSRAMKAQQRLLGSRRAHARLAELVAPVAGLAPGDDWKSFKNPCP